MKPGPFTYHRPDSIASAVSLLDRLDDAKVLAGGQSLVPLMNLRLARPANVVDVTHIEELAEITVDGSDLRIGATVRQASLVEDPQVAQHAPLIADVAAWIGHEAIRNRGTIGGSIAHADPAAELPLALIALGGSLELVGLQGKRVLDAAEIFDGPLMTNIDDHELLAAIRVPLHRPGRAWGFAEVARRHGDFGLVLVAAVLEVRNGLVEDAAIALGAVASTPMRCPAAERSLVGGPFGPEQILTAAAAAAAAADPREDIHASAAYRREMVEVLTIEALTTAAER